MLAWHKTFRDHETGSVSMMKEHQISQNNEDLFIVGRMMLWDACSVHKNCCRKEPQLFDSLNISSLANLTVDLVL